MLPLIQGVQGKGPYERGTSSKESCTTSERMLSSDTTLPMYARFPVEQTRASTVARGRASTTRKRRLEDGNATTTALYPPCLKRPCLTAPRDAQPTFASTRWQRRWHDLASTPWVRYVVVGGEFFFHRK